MSPRESLLFVCLAGIICFSCDSKSYNSDFTTSEDKLFELAEAGWKSKSTTHFIQGIAYKATEVPLQYYILRNQEDINAEEIEKIYETHDDERVIEVEFEHASEDDLLKEEYTNSSYKSAVEYLAFDIQQDFKIVADQKDTIACAGVVFERNYQLAPYKRVLLHFGGVPADSDVQLIYNDQLFGNGLIKFKFNELPVKI